MAKRDFILVPTRFNKRLKVCVKTDEILIVRTGPADDDGFQHTGVIELKNGTIVDTAYSPEDVYNEINGAQQ